MPRTELDQPAGETRFPAGMPPTRTIERLDPPPASDRPTTAQLKADIDSGRTGDKIGVYDPGLSPLGTDDEAAGTPPSAASIRLARHEEGVGRWSLGGAARGTQHTDRRPVALIYGTLVGLVGLAIVGGIVWMG